MALTAKQRAFVNEYLQCWNASEAARRAEYAQPGQQGHRLLKNVEIAAEIARRVADRAMTADEVLVRLAEQARGSIEDFADIQDGIPNGLFLNFEKAKAAGKLGLIKKVKYNAQGYPEIELHDAQAALVHIGKALGLFTEQQEHSGEITLRVVYGTDNPSTETA